MSLDVLNMSLDVSSIFLDVPFMFLDVLAACPWTFLAYLFTSSTHVSAAKPSEKWRTGAGDVPGQSPDVPGYAGDVP